MRGEWKYQKLGSVCKTGAGGTPLKSHKEYYENGHIPWIRSGEVNNRNIEHSEIKITEKGLNNSSAKLFPPRTVVIAMYGATAGQVGILNFECATNQAVCGILPNKDFVPDFLYYFFLKFKDELIAQAVGNAQPNISQAKIKDTVIPILSIEVQKQIVTLLDEAFAAIDQAKANVEKNIANAKELFENWSFNEFTKHKDWSKKKWGEVCDFVRGPFGGSLKKSMFVESGYVVYEQKHAIHNHFNQLRYFIDEQKFNEMLRFEVKVGDIIMSCSGVTLGRVAVIPEDIPRGIINQALLKLTSKKEINVHFLKLWLRSPIFQKIIFDYSGGAAQPNVPAAKILKGIELPCPSITEQNELIRRFENFKKLYLKSVENYQKELNELEALKKSLLQKAFAGELTQTETLA